METGAQRRRELNIAVLGLSSATQTLGNTLWIFFLPLYYVNLGATLPAVGLIYTANLLVWALSSLPAGWLADKFGRKPIIILSTLISASATSVIALTSNLFLAALAYVFYGLALGFFLPVMGAIIAESVSDSRRGRAFGRFFTMSSIPAIFGPLIGSTLGGIGHYPMILILASLLTLIAAANLVVLLKETLPANIQKSAAQLRPYLRDLRAAISNRTFLSIVLAYSAYNLFVSESSFVVPLYARETIHMSSDQIGLMFTIIVASTTLVSLPAGKIADRIGRQKTVLISWIGEICVIYGFVFSFGPIMALGFAGSWAALGALDGPAIQAWLADTTRQGTRGISLGIFQTTSSLVTVPVPILAGVLFQLNPQWPFYLNSLFSASALALLWKLGRQRIEVSAPNS